MFVSQKPLSESLTIPKTAGIGLKMKNKTLQIAEVLSEGAAFEDGFLGVSYE